MNLEVGSIAGDYQVVGVLGAGGMGKVFKVRNTISDRVEAMKVLLPDLAGEPELGDRFLREIKVLASLNHPNIAGLRTAVRFENQLLMIMEFVEGESLDERLRHGPLPPAVGPPGCRGAVGSLDHCSVSWVRGSGRATGEAPGAPHHRRRESRSTGSGGLPR